MGVAMGTNVYLTVERYVRHDVTVLYNTNEVHEMTFPAVTFCNMCPLRVGFDINGTNNRSFAAL